MAYTIPRESVELVGPITVLDGTTPVTTFEVALLPTSARPVLASWQAPTVVGLSRYILVGPGTPNVLATGTYRLWVRYTASPETPVLDAAGTVVVT